MKRNKIDSENPASIIAAQPTAAKPFNPFPHVPAKRRAALEAMESTAQRKRRFDAQSLEEYAILAAKRFTDAEICAKMNWPLSTFLRWRARLKNSEKLSKLLTRARQAKIEAHLANIEDASRGEGAHARADWHASEYTLRVMDRQRFGRDDSAASVTTNNTAIVLAAGSEEQLAKLIGSWTSAIRPAQPAIDCHETKQIEPSNGD